MKIKNGNRCLDYADEILRHSLIKKKNHCMLSFYNRFQVISILLNKKNDIELIRLNNYYKVLTRIKTTL